MGVLKWVGLIAAGWFALSILVGVAWALGGRRIFRKPPAPRGVVAGDHIVVQIGDKRVIRRVGER